MIVKIYGYKGDSYIRWACDYLKREFNRLAPIVITYFHPDYYLHIKEHVMAYNLDAVLANFYYYFAPYVGIEVKTKDIYLTFWKKSRGINKKIPINTLVIMDSHTMNGEAMDFVKNIINAKNLILVGDPNFGQYIENFGVNYLSIFDGEIIDIIPHYSFPKLICNEIKKFLLEMTWDGVNPYIPKLTQSDIDGEVFHATKFDYIKKFKGQSLVVSSYIEKVPGYLLSEDIPYRWLKEDPLFRFPVNLFKMIDTLDALANETRQLSSEELIRVIRLTCGEITTNYGGREYLVNLYKCAPSFKPKAVASSDFFKKILEYYRMGRIVNCIIPSQRKHYLDWKSKLRNKRWIEPKVLLAHIDDIKCSEHDTVITERFFPVHLMWRILGRCKERLVYLEF